MCQGQAARPPAAVNERVAMSIPDRSHRLRCRQPDVGQEGPRRRGRRFLRAGATWCSRWRTRRGRAGGGSFWRDARARSPVGRCHSGPGRRREPLLGICLGMQWLFEGSEEAPECRGLGVLAGRCRRLSAASAEGRLKVPHVGWNSLERRLDAGIIEGVPARSAGVLHPQLHRAGHRRYRRRHRTRRSDSPRSFSEARLPASSFTRRSRAPSDCAF